MWKEINFICPCGKTLEAKRVSVNENAVLALIGHCKDCGKHVIGKQDVFLIVGEMLKHEGN